MPTMAVPRTLSFCKKSSGTIANALSPEIAAEERSKEARTGNTRAKGIPRRSTEMFTLNFYSHCDLECVIRAQQILESDITYVVQNKWKQWPACRREHLHTLVQWGDCDGRSCRNIREVQWILLPADNTIICFVCLTISLCFCLCSFMGKGLLYKTLGYLWQWHKQWGSLGLRCGQAIILKNLSWIRNPELNIFLV